MGQLDSSGRWILLTALILVQVAMLFACGGGASNSVNPPSPPTQNLTDDQKADQLVAQMTLDEKIQLVHGGAASDWWNHVLPRGGGSWTSGITRLDIPDLYFADGSVGVGNTVGQATALPSSIASAATWDLNEAYKYGQVIGGELSDFGINVNLGGNVNLTGRDSRDGRTYREQR